MSENHHRNNFDFLRFLLASLVVVTHCYDISGNGSIEPLIRATHAIRFGPLAVYGFFAISGYLITASWLRSSSPRSYFQKRLFRIVPGYLVVCLLCVGIVAPLGAASAAAYWHGISLLPLLFSLLTLNIPSVPPTFQGHPYTYLDGSLWTIKYEFICYILVALLGVCGILKRRPLIAALLAIFFTGTMVSNLRHIQLVPSTEHFWGNFQDLSIFVFYFLIGMCFYLFREKIPLRTDLAVVCVVMLVASSVLHKMMYFVLPVFGSYFLFFFAFSPKIPLHNFGKYGDFSYGVYLYNWPVLQLLFHYCARDGKIGPWVLFVLGYPLILLCAVASWFLVERSFLRRKTSAKKERAETVETAIPEAVPAPSQAG